MVVAEDQASLVDIIVNNEEPPFDPVKFLLLVKVALIAVVGSAFFALNAGSIAIISVLVAFIGALVYSQTVGGGAILRGKQSPFQGAAAYWLPQILFFLPGVIAVLEGLVSGLTPPNTEILFSFNAVNSYLSFIQNTDQWFLNVVNYDLATHIENWLIIPSGVVAYDFIKRFTGVSNIQAIVLGAVPLALIFALLHGITALSFALFAFGFMLLLIAGIGYEDTTRGERIPLGLATLTASIGFHRGFNIRSLDQLFAYYDSLLSLGGDFQLIGLGIVATDLIIFSFLVAGLFGRVSGMTGSGFDPLSQLRGFISGLRN